MLAGPSRVGTSTFDPSAASLKLTGTVHRIWSPALEKKGWESTWIWM